MTKIEARTQFAEAVAQDENHLELDRAALLIAAEEYPHLNVEKYLDHLDTFAATCRDEDISYADPFTQIMRISHRLFDELAFRGNTENYYDARNSFLSDVIDRRTGIPITLSVIYIEVARRIGIRLSGVGMPGHFLVKYSLSTSQDRQEIFIDPFHGGCLLTEARCREMIAEMYNGTMEFQPAFLHSVTKKQILTRMLQNLKGIYTRAMDHHKTLSVIERLLLITPDSAVEIRDRGLVFSAMGRDAQARVDLEEYLRREPMAEDAGEVKKRILQSRQRLARLN